MQARGVLTDRHVMPNIVDPVIRGTMSVNHLNQVGLKFKFDAIKIHAGIIDAYYMQVGVIAYLCLEDKPKYRPLITDILHSLIPIVPVGLGGTLTV